MLPTPRVVVIDDEIDHLDGLTRELNRSGVSCLPIRFDGSGENVWPCPHVRVIFADLHLGQGTPTEHTTNFSRIGGIIEESIRPSGPYLVVLWTRYPEQAPRLHDFLTTRLKNVKKPFAVERLDKSEYLSLNGQVRSPRKLIRAIRSIVDARPQISALLEWEDRVVDASVETISSVLEVVELDGAATAENEAWIDRIGKLLACLAAASVGREHVEEDRFRAVNEALLPILADRLLRLRSSDASQKLWRAALSRRDMRENLSIAESARLNRFLHIDLSPVSSAGAERGSVIKLPSSMLKNFEDEFGADDGMIAVEEFGRKNATVDGSACSWVLVQSQAACDYAQMRSGPLPFYLGLCIPNVNVNKKRKIPAAVWSSPYFEIESVPCILRVHGRFQVSLTASQAAKERRIFRLREQLLNSLIYEIHGYGARPGIIAFRGK